MAHALITTRHPWNLGGMSHGQVDRDAVQEGMRFSLVVPLFGLLFACGGDDGGGGATPDAPSNIPAEITISGVAAQKDAGGTTPKMGVMISAYRNSDQNTPVVMTTSDAAGMYSLTIPTNGMPVDGYVKATLSGVFDTYLYPPKALSEDFSGASIYMVDMSTADTLSSLLCGSQQDYSKGVVAILVVDEANNPVEGAMVMSTPAAVKTCFNGDSGFPDKTKNMTAADGIAYLLNLPTGDVSVTASKSGLTFPSHTVNARAGVLTTTVIQP